jgi:chromosome segregation ATPase
MKLMKKLYIQTPINMLLLTASFANDSIPQPIPQAGSADLSDGDSVRSDDLGRERAFEELDISDIPRILHDQQIFRRDFLELIRRLESSISEVRNKNQGLSTQVEELASTKTELTQFNDSTDFVNSKISGLSSVIAKNTARITSLNGNIESQLAGHKNDLFTKLNERCRELGDEIHSRNLQALRAQEKATDQKLKTVTRDILQLKHVLATPEEDGSSQVNPSITTKVNRLEMFIQQSDLNKGRIAALETFLGNPASLTSHDVFEDLLPSTPNKPLDITDMVTHLGRKIVEITQTFDMNVHTVVDSEINGLLSKISKNLELITANGAQISALSGVLSSISLEDVSRLKAIEELIAASVNAKVDDDATFNRINIQLRTLINGEINTLIGQWQNRITACEEKVSEASLTKLSQDLHELQTLVNAQGSQLPGMQTGINGLNSSVTSLQTALTSKIDKCATDAISQASKLNEHIINIKERLTALEKAQPQSTPGSADPVQSDQLSKFSNDLAGLSASVDAFKEQINVQIGQIGKRITTEINQEQSSRDALADHLSSDISGLTSRLGIIESDVNRLNSEDQEIHGLIDSIQQAQGESASDLSQVTQRVQEVENIIGDEERGKTLLAQIADLDARVAGLDNQLAEQDASISSNNQLQSDAILNVRSEVLQEAGALELRLSQRLTALESPNFATSISTLTTTLGETTNRQATMEEKISTLERDLPLLNTRVDSSDSEIKASIQDVRSELNADLQSVRTHLGAFDDKTPTVRMQFSGLESAVSEIRESTEEISVIKSGLAEIRSLHESLDKKVHDIEGVNYIDTLSERLDATTKDVESQLKLLKLTIRGDIESAVNLSSASLTDRLDGHETRLDAMATTAALGQAIDALEEELKALINTNDSNRQNGISDVDNKVTDLNTTLSSKIEGDINALRDELIGQLNGEKAGIVSQITTRAVIDGLIADTDTNLRAFVDEKDAESTKQRGFLTTRVEQLEGQFGENIPALNGRVATAEGDIDRINGLVGTLQIQVANLEAQTAIIGTIQGGLTSLGGRVGALETLTGEALPQLEENVSAGDGFIAAVQELLVSQNQAIQSMQKSVGDLVAEIAAVKATANTTQSAFATFLYEYNNTTYDFGTSSSGR